MSCCQQPKEEDNTRSTTMMQALHVEKSGDVSVQQVHRPPVDGPGFALIRVLRAGVCNTDLEITKGYMGFTGVLGHEFVGVVQELHPLDKESASWLGKRVCGDINVGCQDCAVCHDTGTMMMSRNHCPQRSVLGIVNRPGTMAEYITLPLRNLHLVPDHIPDEVAVFAEPLAAACRIVEQGLIEYTGSSPDKVAILGDGKLGLMIAEVLGRAHSEHFVGKDYPVPQAPILFGKHEHKLRLVQESGVTTQLLVASDDVASRTETLFAHHFDVVVDATGSPAGLALAAKMCRPMGTIVLKSTCASGEEKFQAAPFVVDELRVVGSRCGPIDEALRLLALTGDNVADKSLNVRKYITQTFPLSRAAEALQCAAERSTMKVQIICNEL